MEFKKLISQVTNVLFFLAAGFTPAITILLIALIALQGIVFAVWLIVIGINSSDIVSKIT
ncbi:hypothetical protein ACFL46_01825 [Candidatus Neomarinimicrobiota bacterium]